MKRFFTVSVAVFALATSAFAQKGGSSGGMMKGMNVGVQAGVNMGDVSLDPETTGVDYKTRTGLSVGVNTEIAVTDMFFVQPELNYVQRGFKAEVPDTKVTGKYDYLELPILLKAKFDVGGMKPYVTAGPVIGFLLNAETEAETAGAPTETDDADDVTEDWNFGINVGAGVEYALSSSMGVYLDGRYLFGLTDVSKAAAGETDDQDANHRGFQILAGVRFGM